MTDVPPRDPASWPTPEQLLAELDTLPHDQRLERATRLIQAAQTADNCRTHQHAERLGDHIIVSNCAPIHIACPDCLEPVKVYVLLKQDGNLIRLALPEDDFTQAFAAHAMAAPEQHPTLVVRT